MINTFAYIYELIWGASQLAIMVKNLSANAGDKRHVGSIPGSGRSPEGGHGNQHQFLPGKFHGQRSLAGYCPFLSLWTPISNFKANNSTLNPSPIKSLQLFFPSHIFLTHVCLLLLRMLIISLGTSR